MAGPEQGPAIMLCHISKLYISALIKAVIMYLGGLPFIHWRVIFCRVPNRYKIKRYKSVRYFKNVSDCINAVRVRIKTGPDSTQPHSVSRQKDIL